MTENAGVPTEGVSPGGPVAAERTLPPGFVCRNCASREARVILRGLPDRLSGVAGSFSYGRCTTCGLAQLLQVPTDLGPFYAGYRLHRPNSSLYQVVRGLLVGRCYYRPPEPAGTVLDVGCGNGWYLESLQRRGWRGYGYEPDAAYAAQLSRDLGLPVFSRLEDLFARCAGRLDLVTFHFSFEHLSSPRDLLQCAARCLRPGGRMYLAVPNFEGREARLFGARWFHLDAPRHITLFGRRLLESLLGELGFGSIRIRNLPVPTGFAGSVSYRLCGRLNPMVWYASILPGLLFACIVRDGNMGILATKQGESDERKGRGPLAQGAPGMPTLRGESDWDATGRDTTSA